MLRREAAKSCSAKRLVVVSFEIDEFAMTPGLTINPKYEASWRNYRRWRLAAWALGAFAAACFAGQFIIPDLFLVPVLVATAAFFVPYLVICMWPCPRCSQAGFYSSSGRMITPTDQCRNCHLYKFTDYDPTSAENPYLDPDPQIVASPAQIIKEREAGEQPKRYF